MLGLVDTLRLKADNSVKLKAIAHSTPSELGTLWVAARRLHLRLFIFNPFGILGKLFISHSLIYQTKPPLSTIDAPTIERVCFEPSHSW